ncbi:MAG: biopolymer transporter ExbD [Bacteroidales bacterium]|nr:biopolymer transporter ExbD [Bacteroidales bacterium]
MAIQSRNRIEKGYSVAGMTDIVFLLLIFFVLTSTLVAPNALKLLLPQSNSQVEAKPLTTVSITGDLKYYVEKTQVEFDQLEPVLQKKLRFREDPIISLHTDRSVAIEHIVKVMNIARKNNFKLILATNPE